MSERNRRLVLAERPTGMVDASTTRLEEGEIPAPRSGQALARVRYISIDPTIRTWMNDAPGYLPPIGIGEVIRAGGIAEVIESNSERYSAGDLLFGMTGWQDYVIADEGANAMQRLPAGITPTSALSVFGITGLTAYFGLIDVGKIAEGDVVVVSGAAGATGSTVGQIAKIKGASKVDRDRRGAREVRLDRRRARLRRRHRLQVAGHPPTRLKRRGSGHRHLLRQRRRRDPRTPRSRTSRCTAAWCCAGRSRATTSPKPSRPGELHDADRQARADGGLHHPGLRRPLPGGAGRAGRLARGRAHQGRRARRRGPAERSRTR